LAFFAQSASAVQLSLHAFAAASQPYGMHSIRAGIAHVPARQVATGLSRSLPSQDAAAQGVPSALGEQVPSRPGTAHELQAAQAADPQQNPSTQWPLMQSLLEVQVIPLAARLVHEPPWQLVPARQSVLDAQVVLQAAVPQT
jgi:hypothetical protein